LILCFYNATHFARLEQARIGKNLPSIPHRDEVRVFKLVTDIDGRIQTGKRVKVLNEMRLIEIAAVVGDVGPLDALLRRDLRQDLLKTSNSTKQLWR
jgi:hypothetical protein